jgi:gliding motility-associated-like protein
MSFSLLGAGNYTIYVEDNTGRVFTTDIVIPSPPKANILAFVTPAKCNNGSNDGAIHLSTNTAEINNFTYLWSNDSTSNQITYVPAGPYKVTCTWGENNQCTETPPTMVIGSGITVDVVTTWKDTLVCKGTDLILNAESVSVVPVTNGTFHWFPGDYINASQSIVADSAVKYYVQLTDFNGCYDIDSSEIKVFPNPPLYTGNNPVFIASNGQAQIALEEGFTSYLWSPGLYMDNPTLRDPIIRPDGTIDFIEYIVQGITDQMCFVYDTIYVMAASKLIIPSGFSPNGDGVNDAWEILYAEEYSDIHVEVFNRAGQRVYESTGYDNDTKIFDGKRNGKDLPIGTYYYVIIPTKGEKGITGSVTIVR